MPLSASKNQEAVADALARAYGRARVEVQPSGEAKVVGMTDDIERLITTVPREITGDFGTGTRVKWWFNEIAEDEPEPHRGIVVGYNPDLSQRIVVDDSGKVFYRWVGLEMESE